MHSDEIDCPSGHTARKCPLNDQEGPSEGNTSDLVNDTP